MYDLRPCPFCGGPATLSRTSRGLEYHGASSAISDMWRVACSKGCIAIARQSKIYQNDKGEVIVAHNGAEEAVVAWNTRAGT